MSVNPVTGVAMAAMQPAFAPAMLAAPVATSADPATAQSQFYTSPVVTLDDSGLAVLQFRDSNTGEVKAQVPPERVVEQYRLRGSAPGPDAMAASVPTRPGQGGAPVGDGAATGTTAENGGAETGQKVAVNA